MFKWLTPKEFTWLNKQGVESRKGFVVQFTGRFSAEYREKSRKVSLFVEDGVSGGKPCVMISPDMFRHWDGELAENPIEKQIEMQANFKRALQFQGLELLVERPLSMQETIAAQREQYLSFLQAGKRVTINGREIKNENELNELLREMDAT